MRTPWFHAFRSSMRHRRFWAAALALTLVGVACAELPADNAVTALAVPSPSVQAGSAPVNEWKASYWNSRRESGSPVLTRTESTIGFNTYAPIAPGVRTDGWSARYLGAFPFEDGAYTFSVTADDGVVLYVDAKMVISQWRNQAARRYTTAVTLTKGLHTVQVDYYDDTSAAVLSYDVAPSSVVPAPSPGPTTTAAPTTTTAVRTTTTTAAAPAPSPAPAPAPAPVPGTRDAALWPFSASGPWNVPRGEGATFTTDARTSDVRSGVGWVNAGSWSQPVYVAAASDPLRTVSGRNQTLRYQIPAGARPSPDDDAEMNVISPDHRWVNEIYGAVGPDGGGNYSTSWNLLSPIDLQGPGGGADLGIRASGVPAIAGLIRTWELNGGSIKHAIAVSLSQSKMLYGPYVWPAVRDDPFGNQGGHVPMGTFFAIPSNVNVNALGLSAGGLMLAKALQDYGGYVVDTGGAMYAEQSAEGNARLAEMRDDLGRIMAQVQVVTNNSSSNPGGGGSPRAPFAPAFG
ncbi:MAG: PA14 domain-containing protein [Acidimicrobiia bacterium]